MWRITPIHRALAGVLAAALVATSLPPEAFAQSPLHWSAPGSPSPFDLQHLDLSALSIPPSLGEVIDVWQPEGPARGVVFHLQDVHAHAEAQFQLSTLIEELQEAAEIKLVAVEGTAGRCETELYSSLPDPPSTEKVARLFVQESLFSGPEYYAITHPDRVTLWGVEDDAIFREHLNVSQQGSSQAASLADILSRLQKALEERIDILWPADMQRLHHLRWQYETDLAAPSLTAYVDALLKQLDTLKGKAEEYPNLLRFSDTQYVLARIQPIQVDRERRRLLRALQKQLPTPQRRQLAQLNGHFERRELAPATYYTALITLAGAAGKRYAALSRYAQALQREATIKPALLQQEIETLAARVQDARLTDERAHLLAQVLEQTVLLTALVQTRLSPSEYRRYHAFAGTLTAEHFWDDLQRLNTATASVTAEELAQVFKGLAPYQRFYELAQQRDEALVRNTLAQMQAQSKASAILIAGGFHTPGLTAQLQTQGIAYAVIAPRVTEAFDAALYQARLGDEMPSFEQLAAKLAQQTLSTGVNFGTTGDQQARFQWGGAAHSLTRISGLWKYFIELKNRTMAEADRQFAWLQNWFLTHPQLAEQLGWTLIIAGGTATLSGWGTEAQLTGGAAVLMGGTQNASSLQAPAAGIQQDQRALEVHTAFLGLQRVVNARLEHSVLRLGGFTTGPEVEQGLRELMYVLLDKRERFYGADEARSEAPRWVREEVIPILEGTILPGLHALGGPGGAWAAALPYTSDWLAYATARTVQTTRLVLVRRVQSLAAYSPRGAAWLLAEIGWHLRYYGPTPGTLRGYDYKLYPILLAGILPTLQALLAEPAPTPEQEQEARELTAALVGGLLVPPGTATAHLGDPHRDPAKYGTLFQGWMRQLRHHRIASSEAVLRQALQRFGDQLAPGGQLHRALLEYGGPTTSTNIKALQRYLSQRSQAQPSAWAVYTGQAAAVPFLQSRQAPSGRLTREDLEATLQQLLRALGLSEDFWMIGSVSAVGPLSNKHVVMFHPFADEVNGVTQLHEELVPALRQRNRQLRVSVFHGGSRSQASGPDARGNVVDEVKLRVAEPGVFTRGTDAVAQVMRNLEALHAQQPIDVLLLQSAVGDTARAVVDFGK